MEKETKKNPLKLMTLTVVLVLIAMGGVATRYVLVHNEIYTIGRASSEMEAELVSLRHDLRHTTMRWEAANDREELKRRLMKQRTLLKGIDESAAQKLSEAPALIMISPK